MSVQVVSTANRPLQGSLIQNYMTSQSAIKPAVPVDVKSELKFSSSDKDKASDKRVKIGAMVGTTIGIAAVMAEVLHKKGFSLNPKKIIKTPIKDWGLVKVKYDDDKQEIEKLIVKLAAGAIGGGFAAGALLDKKEHLAAKTREGIVQFLGNNIVPLIGVVAGMRGFKKVQPKIVNYIEKNISKNNIVKNLPEAIASTASLIGAIYLGNEVSNKLNEKVFKVKDNRKIKLGDMAPHLDDVCFVLSIVLATNKIGPFIARLVPATLLVGGYEVGRLKERPEVLAAKAAKAEAAKSAPKSNAAEVVK